MTAFKPGDRVTSTLLVGEWTFDRVNAPSMGIVRISDAVAEVPTSTLTPVAPPLPPEPPIGSGVFVEGVLWCADNEWGTWHIPGHDRGSTWANIADRATPAVPLADIVAAFNGLADRWDEFQRDIPGDACGRGATAVRMCVTELRDKIETLGGDR